MFNPTLIELHDDIVTHFAKAKALSQISLSDDFLNYDQETVMNYLWSLSDLIQNASLLYQQLIQQLEQASPQPPSSYQRLLHLIRRKC